MKDYKALIFLDIDRTLLDPSYRSNDPSLKDTIGSLQKEGYVFALNSNRALEDLLPVAKQFGIQGVLIGENGLFAYDSTSEIKKYFLDDAKLKQIVEAKKKTQRNIKTALNEIFADCHIYWEDTDTVTALSTENPTNYEEGSIVLFNNSFRNYTISAHLLVNRQGKLVRLAHGLLPVVERVQELSPYPDITITPSRSFSNILMYSSLASKRTAVERILVGYQDIPIFAIGDDIDDYYMVKNIGTFLSTGNALSSVKEKAAVCSEAQYTAGVHELILQIAGK